MTNRELKQCKDWLAEQQEALEGASMGMGKEGVQEKVREHRAVSRDVQQFRSSVDSLLDTRLPEDTKKELDLSYKAVSALSKRREECLETVSQVATLEDFIQSISTEFDSKAQHLVNMGESGQEMVPADHQQPSDLCLSNESLARASQNCIHGVRENWRWLFQIFQCAQVHLRNAAAYHQFFHEVEEAEHWMNTTLSRIHLTFDRTKLEGSRTDALAMQKEIKDVLSAFLQWQTKTDYLFDKAKSIVPVPQRTTALKQERSVLALTDFSNKEIKIIEGETLFLMDNANRKEWKVRNNAGEVAVVPAVIILIPAPFSPATETALRLRRQLLALWTGSVKRLGYQLIAFMLLVFRDWNQEEVNLLQRLSPRDRSELMEVLQYLENTLLQQSWQGYGDFQELQERIHRLVMIVEEAVEGPDTDNEFLQTVVIQIRTLGELLRKYQDFWTFWETYKTIVEMVKQPELLLVCDKWEQLNYRATAHLVKFWDTNLDLTEGDMTKQTATLALQETPSELITDVTIDKEQQDTTTETVSTSITEEQYTYVVKGVVDPRDNQTELDLQTAIMLGIVDQAQGLYINPVTGATQPMKDAMADGKVMIQALSKKKLSEEKKSYGLLTIRITRESRPYTIHGVRDQKTNKILTVEEATQNGILTSNATYRLASGGTISLPEAIEQGLLDVTYDEEHAHTAPEVACKTYAVHGVVNQRSKKKVSFSDAVRQGLLNKDTGEYFNNVTLEHLPAQEAIMRGFVKARYVQDPAKLDIDPRNQIVVQKLESAKKKLMQEIHTLSAFKSMSKHH